MTAATLRCRNINTKSVSFLQTITGINRHQLSHYATGKSRPSSKTVQRIQEGITRFSEELRMVCLV